MSLLIVNLTRGHIVLKVDEKTVIIYGEGLLRGFHSPDFVVFANSIKHWDAPHDRDEISIEEKREILDFLTEEFARRNMRIEIED